MKPLSQEKIFITILILFSILVNQYYGNRGVFPIDSFLNFDAAFNIVAGNHPFRDYWLITGPFVDYIQSFFTPFCSSSKVKFAKCLCVCECAPITTPSAFSCLISFQFK